MFSRNLTRLCLATLLLFLLQTVSAQEVATPIQPSDQLKQVAGMVVQLSAVNDIRECGADVKGLHNSFRQLLGKAWYIYSIAQRRQMLNDLNSGISELKKSEAFQKQSQEVSCEKVHASVSGLRVKLIEKSKKSADEQKLDNLDNNVAYLRASDKTLNCQQDFTNFSENYSRLLKNLSKVRDEIIKDRIRIITAKSELLAKTAEVQAKIIKGMTCEKVSADYAKIIAGIKQINGSVKK